MARIRNNDWRSLADTTGSYRRSDRGSLRFLVCMVLATLLTFAMGLVATYVNVGLAAVGIPLLWIVGMIAVADR